MQSLLNGEMELHPDTIETLRSIREKTRLLRSSFGGMFLRVMSNAELAKNFSPEENDAFRMLRDVDTSTLGVVLPQQSTDVTSEPLVLSPDQLFIRNDRQEWTGGRHITATALTAFFAMSSAADVRLGRPLILQSAYRSPAYQGLLFIDELVKSNFDVVSTIKHASIPGFSEHTDTDWLATDIMPHTVNTPDFRFENTPEYAWLKEHASEFDFYESYPEDNDTGLIFEPWHWQHRPIK